MKHQRLRGYDLLRYLWVCVNRYDRAGNIRRACEGNKAVIIADNMLYNLGFVLPFVEAAAHACTRFATLSVALADDFTEYCSRAKLEARDAPNEIWPVSI